MKKLLSLILAITMIAAFIPTAFAADGDATTVTYTFTQAGKGANTDWMEQITKTNDGSIATAIKANNFNSEYGTTENSDPNKRWAYVGTNVKYAASPSKKSTDQPVLLYSGSGTARKYFLRTNEDATTANDWVALKIKVPADGNYKVTGATAFRFTKASSNIDVYILPMDLTVDTDDDFNGKQLSEVFARGSAIYGDLTISSVEDSSIGLVIGHSVRNNAKKFTDLGISSGNQVTYKAVSLDVSHKSVTLNKSISGSATLSGQQVIKLSADKEYILLFCTTADNKAISIESLTLSTVAENEPTNTPTELTGNVTFGAGAAIEYKKTTDTEFKSLTANGVDSTSFVAGDSVTVKVTNTENFAGWVRGTKDSGVWVSSDAEYTFSIISPTYLTPIWTSAPAEGSKKVEFWNENGAYIDSSDVTDGMAEVPATEDVKLAGYTFSGWWTDAQTQLTLTDGAVNVSALSDAIIRAVAKHNAVNSFGTPIFKTNANATHWKRGGVTVAYGTDYTFYQWNGVPTITACEGNVEKNPLVVLDSTPVDGAYMIEYDKGNAAEIVEAGILFGSDDDINIGSTDGSKAASQRNGVDADEGDDNGHGQFCAKPNTESNYDYARGYLIYRGTDNKLYVIYTAAVSTSAQ